MHMIMLDSNGSVYNIVLNRGDQSSDFKWPFCLVYSIKHKGFVMRT